MPELPEVETIKNDLQKFLKGKRIKNVRVLNSRSVRPRPPRFENMLRGKKIVGIHRRGKALLFDLGNFFLVARLGMTGQLLFTEKNRAGKHDRGRIILEGGKILIYRDIRKFGYLKIVKKEKLELFLKSFGPEPLDPRFSAQALGEIVQKFPRSTVKGLLLNQKRISGIGNIYADESCFRARIFPGRALDSLKDREIRKLYAAIRGVLGEAIKHRGTTFRDYRDAGGEKGKFAKSLAVYGRRGKPCFNCGVTIAKIRMAGRGTHYCPRCQK